MDRTRGKRALMVRMVAWVLLLLALGSASGVLAALITYDFTGKVAGSTVENPHVAYTLAAATPDESPATILAQAAEFSQADYDGVEVDDITYAALGASTGWMEVGSGGIAIGGGRWPSLALDASGNPYVAWSVYIALNSQIYIKRYDGANWVEVGSGSASGGGIGGASYDAWPSLALDGSGSPYVAWEGWDNTSGDGGIYIKRYDGTSWVEVGSGSASGGGIGSGLTPSLAVDAWGNPYVAYTGGVKRFDGSAWVEVGSSSPGGHSLGLDPSGNPYVACGGNVKRYDGANWVEVGTGLGSSWPSSMALDGSGNPYVAWSDDTSGNEEIYIKRYDAANWVEVGSGSASGGGISDNSGASYYSPVALDGSGNPYVAWYDNTGGGWAIYIKRFFNPYPEYLYEFQLLDVDIDQLTPSVWAYGTAEAGNGVTVNIWNNATSSWELVGTNTASSMPSAPVTAEFTTSPEDYVDGSDKVYIIVRATNPSGGSSPATLYVDYVKLDVNYPDLTPPTGSVVVNGGDEYANSGDVTLTLSASDGSGVSQMRFSNDGTNWSGWEAYATSKAWTLSSGDGTKTVYVEYRDDPGNICDPISDTIILDTTPPDSSISVLPLWHKTLTFTVSWSGTDNIAGIATYDVQYRDGGGSWTNLLRRTTLTSTSFSGQDGHTYCFRTRARDTLDNLEAYPGGDGDGCTTVDVTGPSGAIIINEGALYTTSVDVLLSLSVSGATQMRFSNDGASYSEWENYADSKAWTLSSGDGEKTVYVKYRDEARNTSVFTDTIVLDTSMGSEYGASINKGALYTNQISVTLSLGAPAYTPEMKVSNDGGFAGAEWEPFAVTKPWVITAYGSQIIPRTVYVRFRDTDGVSSATYTDDIILDTNAPTSEVTRARVAAASEHLPETSLVPVKVTWTGEDENSGVKWYDIQYRVDRSGTWTKWLRRTKRTSAIFNVTPGHTYYFRSRARDMAGNWEKYPRGDGDISIRIGATTNLLSNGSFEDGGRIPAPWRGNRRLTIKDGRVCDTGHDGSCSFRMVGTRAKKSLRQVVRVSGNAGGSFTLSGWSRARDPSSTGGAYCLQARVFHTDGTKKAYRTCFAKRTHGWQYRERSFTADKDYNKIVILLLYARQSGKAWFDDVKLLVPR